MPPHAGLATAHAVSQPQAQAYTVQASRTQRTAERLCSLHATSAKHHPWTANKSARLDLGTNVAATSAAHGPLLAPGFSDLIQPGCNPFNGKPYSRRYHDI